MAKTKEIKTNAIAGHVLLLHAHCGAAAADVAGDLVDVLHMDHLHALYAHAPGGGL